MEFCKVTLTFESMDEILWCYHANENSLPVLGAICFSIGTFGWNLLLAKFGSERVKCSFQFILNKCARGRFLFFFGKFHLVHCIGPRGFSWNFFLRENLSKGKTSRTRVLVHGFLCKTQEAMKGDLDLTRSCSSYHILSICRVVCIFKR